MDEIQKKKLEEKYIREGYWKGETFSSMLQKCAEAYGEQQHFVMAVSVSVMLHGTVLQMPEHHICRNKG